MNHLVSLVFKDTEKEVNFELNKNTLFFGNNGRGKTRVLKTLESLYELIHKSDPKEAYDLIDKMYLEKLHIGDFDCVDLFKNSNSLKRQNIQQLNKYLRVNRLYFRRIQKDIIELRKELRETFDIDIYNLHLVFDRKIESILSKLNFISHNQRAFEYLSDLETFFSDLESLLDQYRILIRYEEPSFSYFATDNVKKVSSNLHRVEFHLQKLKSSYYEESLQFNNLDEKERKKFEKNRDKIITFLKSKKAHFITTDKADIEEVIGKIKINISSVNSKIQKWIWNNDEELYNQALSEKEKILVKIQKFNKLMMKYGNITLELDNNATLKFSKEQRGISFEKFSSGERKITYLFLEILFNEVDVFLIDEPELSISLNYQNKIVWDLHCLTEGKALFIATHAPFVYEDFKKFPGNTVVEVK